MSLAVAVAADAAEAEAAAAAAVLSVMLISLWNGLLECAELSKMCWQLMMVKEGGREERRGERRAAYYL